MLRCYSSWTDAGKPPSTACCYRDENLKIEVEVRRDRSEKKVTAKIQKEKLGGISRMSHCSPSSQT